MKKRCLFVLFLSFLILFLVPSCQDDYWFDNPNNSEDIPDDEGDTENGEDHDDEDDYTWNSSDEVEITLNGSSITVNGSGATASGSTLTVNSAGSYRISGSLTNGQIIVDTDDEDIVRLILNGVSITCSSSAPVFIRDAEKAMVVLEEGTSNSLTDGSNYTFEDGEDEPNACLFSKSDLTLFGEGSLHIDANYNDGIASKDGLIISSGSYDISSVDDGIRGKDYLIIKEAEMDIDAEGDGLKSDNEDDESLGYISIADGEFSIDAGGDAIQAVTDIQITTGDYTITSGGGSSYTYDTSVSKKGLKAGVSLIVDGGDFVIQSADDALHSNTRLTVNGGTFSISSGDDGMHADSYLYIYGGEIDISKCYEGIEAAIVTIDDGTIHVVSSDDGINVAGGNDSSGSDRPGGDSYSSGDYAMYINGGYIVLNTTGDGLDANGSINMTGGTVLINGPTSDGNGALDYDSSFKITGGFLLAVGSSGMAQAPSSSSSQYSVLATFRNSQQAGTLVHLETSGGTDIFSFKPTKRYASVVFSSPDLSQGSRYSLYLGGSCSGTVTDGLYEGGSYTGGSQYTSFTISNIVTKTSN